MMGASRLRDAARVLTLALFVALPFTAGYMFDEHLLGTSLVVLVIALILFVGGALGGRTLLRPDRPLLAPLMLLIAWYLVSALASVYLHASLVSLLQLIAYVLLMLICASLFEDERWRRAAWIAIAAAGSIEGIIGLRDWTQTVIFQGDPRWRIFGTMYNPNVLAGYLVVALAAAAVVLALAWRYTQERTDRPRFALIAAGFAPLILGGALLLTASRAGMLGALAGAATFAVAAPTRIRARWFVAAGLALLLVVAVAPPLRNRLISATAQSNSAIFRWYTWVGTAEMIRERPLLGYGPGTFEHAYPQHAIVGFTRMAHQTPLQIAAEAGVPALLLALAAVAMIARRLIAGLRSGGMRALECAAGLAALAAVGVHNLADYTWYVPAVGMSLTAILGLALVPAQGEASEAPPRRWPLWLAAALALIVALLAAGGLQAQRLQAQAKAMVARGHYQPAAAALRRAAELDPLDAGIAADLAQAVAVTAIGPPTRALELRLRAAELNPLDGGNYVGLAELYARLDEEQSALAAAQRAVEVAPNSARSYVTLAQLQERFGRADEALATWRALDELYKSPVGQIAAIEQPTDFLWAYAWLPLAEAAEERGDRDEAARYFRQAADLTGGYAEMQRAVEEAMKLLGSWNEAMVAEAERMQRSAEAGLRRLGESDG
jgi:putative inorganic carbon (HCO3(-)) transporter